MLGDCGQPVAFEDNEVPSAAVGVEVFGMK